MKLTTCLLFLALAPTAGAGSITYSAPFGNRDLLPVFPGFDPTLGQLTRVDIDVQGGASGFWYTDDGSEFSSGTFHLFFQVFVGLGEIVGSVITSDPFTLGGPTFMLPWSGGFDVQSTLTDDLGRFQGPSVSPYFMADAWFDIDTGVQLDGSLSRIDGIETITYTYATLTDGPLIGLPVTPEPSSWIMMVVGAVGLGLIRWRTR